MSSHKTPQPSSSSKMSDLPCYAQKPPITYLQQESSESLIIDSRPSTEGGCKAADESDVTPDVMKASAQSSNSKKSSNLNNKVSVSIHLVEDHDTEGENAVDNVCISIDKNTDIMVTSGDSIVNSVKTSEYEPMSGRRPRSVR